MYIIPQLIDRNSHLSRHIKKALFYNHLITTYDNQVIKIYTKTGMTNNDHIVTPLEIYNYDYRIDIINHKVINNICTRTFLIYNDNSLYIENAKRNIYIESNPIIKLEISKYIII